MDKRINQVKKRDGRIVPFDKGKISDAIFKAAQSVGGQDRYLADDLAEAVRMYLETQYKGDMPSVEEIQDIVERVLIKTGHARTAKSYILYRQRRARARQIREGLSPEDLTEREQAKAEVSREAPLSVRRSRDNIAPWDPSVVVSALVRETGLPENIAELIVGEVEDEIVASKAKRLTSSLIRETVNAKLVQYGFEEERKLHSRIGLPVYDVTSMFEKFDGGPDSLSMQLGRYVKREYAMTSVLPEGLVEKHLRGELSVCNIEGIDKFYSANIAVAQGGGEAISRLCGKVRPFTEHEIILRFPEGAAPKDAAVSILSSGEALVAEVPLAGLSDNALKEVSAGGFSFVLRIENKAEMERFASMAENTGLKGRIAINRKTTGALFVLNRLILNVSMPELYAGQKNAPAGDYIRELLQFCSAMIEKQGRLIAQNPAAMYMFASLGGAEKIMEIECPDLQAISGCLRADENFLADMLDKSISCLTKLPAKQDDTAGFYSLLSSMFERFSGQQGLCVRICNG
ncbi:MAG: hypothetical protein JW957_05435 [Candidatus Omnitrophica bacterium]|nr:hypothetical protein [Candidatus Omnitrophota bacterium]